MFGRTPKRCNPSSSHRKGQKRSNVSHESTTDPEARSTAKARALRRSSASSATPRGPLAHRGGVSWIKTAAGRRKTRLQGSDKVEWDFALRGRLQSDPPVQAPGSCGMTPRASALAKGFQSPWHSGAVSLSQASTTAQSHSTTSAQPSACDMDRATARLARSSPGKEPTMPNRPAAEDASASGPPAALSRISSSTTATLHDRDAYGCPICPPSAEPG